MESEVRNRKQQEQAAAKGRDSSGDESDLPAANSAAKIDRNFTSLLVIAAAGMVAAYLLLSLWPDSLLRSPSICHKKFTLDPIYHLRLSLYKIYIVTISHPFLKFLIDVYVL